MVEGAMWEAVQQTLGAGPVLRIRFEVPADAEYAGGLALYGEPLGCYPMAPTLFLDSE
jgi:predicted transcriptional regulator